MAAVSGIPVLSFPAILRNPGLTDRYAHLRESASSQVSNQLQTRSAFKKKHKYDNEGKRWVRRKENAHFVGNPHIVPASRRDYTLQTPRTHSTFPEPLPAYLPRTVKLPAIPSPGTDPYSANAGRFSISLKGMRRDLRRAGGRAEALVKDIESEMVQWLAVGGTVLTPDSPRVALEVGGTPVGTTATIFEISRTPLQLVWRITDDSFARYVVHCCARYHEIVSFSKGSDENRLTYLLRPNVTRPDHRVQASLETPPVTDIDYSSNPETDDFVDSDFVSDRDMESDAELDGKHDNLSTISESPAPSLMPLPAVDKDLWSDTGVDGFDAEFEADEFESGSEFGSELEASVDILQPRLQALSLNSSPTSAAFVESHPHPAHPTSESPEDPSATVIMQPDTVFSPSRRRDWKLSARSPSSPSRSPARTRHTRRRSAPEKRAMNVRYQSEKTFYEYLFM